MPVSASDKDEERIIAFAEQSIRNGAESWQIEDFLKKNAEKLGIQNIQKVHHKETKPSLKDEKEVVEFDLMIMPDGTAFKANISTTKDPEGNPASTFSADMTGITDPKQAKEILSKLLDITLQTKLQFHPANTELRLYSQGSNRWDDVRREVEEEQCAKYAALFREKGIQLYINDKLMIGPEPAGELENASQEKRPAKPWDVPRGAPDARPKRE